MMIELPYPERKDDIIRGTRKHHYSRTCPGVWRTAFCILNQHGKVQAAIIYGNAPYPTVARAFCRQKQDIPRHLWIMRMWGAGITREQLDQLIQYSHKCLLQTGDFSYLHTLTNPYAYTIQSHMRLQSRGYTGAVYHRNNYLYLGWAGRKATVGFLIDGKIHHIRQGNITLTKSNVRDYFPTASEIRPITGKPKQRWAKILAKSPREYENRLLLMKYRPQVYTPLRQPRLMTSVHQLLQLLLILHLRIQPERR